MRSVWSSPSLRPGLAAVGAAVDAVAHRHAVAHPGLAGARPRRLRVRRIDRDGADRLVVLVEDGLERDAAVHGFPEPAAGGPGVDREAVAGHRVEGGDAPAHGGRADGPRLQAAEGVAVDRTPCAYAGAAVAHATAASTAHSRAFSGSRMRVGPSCRRYRVDYLLLHGHLEARVVDRPR